MCVKRRGDAFASMGLGKGGECQYKALKSQAKQLKIQGGHNLTQIIE